MVSAQFESARVHPRRRPVLNTSLPSMTPEAESSSSKMQLKKGETFSTPMSPPSNDCDPVLNIRSLPRRSPTSLDAIAASEQRMASILERLTLDDQPEEKPSSAENLDSMCSMDEVKTESDSDMFPSDAKDQQQSKQQQQQEQEDDHESDSGLGSSISSTESDSDRTEKGVCMCFLLSCFPLSISVSLSIVNLDKQTASITIDCRDRQSHHLPILSIVDLDKQTTTRALFFSHLGLADVFFPRLNS